MINNTQLCDVIYIADKYGIEEQKKMLIEECSELIQAICKTNRAETIEQMNAAKKNLVEEMADVVIMLNQVNYLLCLDDDISKMIDFKIKRQISRIEGKEELE